MNHKANILIVDDEEVVRLSLLRSLARANYVAGLACDGLEAISLMEQQPFDIVFLDLLMPELNGISVLRIIKKRWPDSEVIIITGYPDIDTAKEAVGLGAYDYLVKPVSPDDLVKAASEAMTHKGWALRLEGPARKSVQILERRPWLDEQPDQRAENHHLKHGGTS